MKTLKLEDVTNVRAWKGKRLYLTVDGVSSYQHRKGAVFVEYLGNKEWKPSMVVKKYVGNIEELNGMDFEEAKEALGL